MSNREDPWLDLPRAVADTLEPGIADLTAEIVAAIASGIPEYARPLESPFGEAVRGGVERALRRFVALIRDPGQPDDQARRDGVALGRGEHAAGRTLDALQAAYRLGARVAWRQIAAVAAQAELEPGLTARLAEAIFAYIDELSALAVEGYADAQSERAGERERRRSELVAALLGLNPAADLTQLARAAQWVAPNRASLLACRQSELPALARQLDHDRLSATVGVFGCVVIPGEAVSARERSQIERAMHGRRAALGFAVPLPELAATWPMVTACLSGVGPATAADTDPAREGLICVDDALAALLLDRAAPVVRRIGAVRLRGFAELSPIGRARMTGTALAYVQHGGNAAAIARALAIHPQTARYRIARLRELLGEQLDDPAARFELEAALRAELLRTA